MKLSNLFSVSVLFSASLALSRPHQEVLVTPEALEHDNETLRNFMFLPTGGDQWTFPFQNSPSFTDPSTFVTNLYRGNGDKKPWLNHTDARDPDVHPWMIKYIGNERLTPTAGEPVGDSRNPKWRWAEMWRVFVVYKTLLSTNAAKANGNGHAVTEYLGQLGDDARNLALFPEAVRNLLIANEEIIASPGRTLAWVGHPSRKPKGSKPFQPFGGIEITSGLNMRFGQECPVGPFSIEASFILATQLAGINWKTLNSKLTQKAMESGVYWMNAIIPYDKQDNHIMEYRGGGYADRVFGYLSRRPKDGVAGSPDAGYWFVLDIDPNINNKNPEKNVFVFAVHPMDPSSRIYFPYPDRLHHMTYQTPYAVSEWEKKREKIKDNQGGANIRFYAHGHGAVLNCGVFEKWLAQDLSDGRPGEKRPDYSQIGSMHLYFLPEDDHSNDVWPRAAYIRDDKSRENPDWYEPGFSP